MSKYRLNLIYSGLYGLLFSLPVVKNTSSRRRSARIQKSKNKTPEPEVETIEEEQQGKYPFISVKRLSATEIVALTSSISEETVEEEPVAEVKTEEVVVEAVKEPNCVSKLYTALCNNFHTIVSNQAEKIGT